MKISFSLEIETHGPSLGFAELEQALKFRIGSDMYGRRPLEVELLERSLCDVVMEAAKRVLLDRFEKVQLTHPELEGTDENGEYKWVLAYREACRRLSVRVMSEPSINLERP